MKFRLWFLFTFFVLAVQSQNQSSYIKFRDSFLKYEYIDTVRASGFLKELKEYALRNEDNQVLAEYCLLKGWLAQDGSDFHKAMVYFKKMAFIAKKYGLTQSEADAYGNIANVYDDLSDDVRRMQYHQLSLEMNEKILRESKDPETRKKAMTGKSAALGNISHHYMELKQFDKAIEFVKEGMKLDSILKNDDFLSISYITLGNIYKDQKLFQKSLRMFYRSVAIRKKQLEKENTLTDVGMYQAMHNIGNIHKETGYLDSAEYYFNESMTHAEKVGDKLHMTYMFSSLGDLEMKRGNVKKAIELHNRAFELSNQLKSNDRIYQTADFLSESYAAIADYKNAYRYLRIMNQYRDSIFNADKLREVGKAEVNFKFKFKSSLDSLNYSKQLEEKEKIRLAQEEAHSAETARKNIILYGVIFILVVVLFFSIYLVKLYRQKQKAHEIISRQKKMTEQHLNIIEEKQKEIVDSINYAKRIQYALLAHEEIMQKYLPEHFVLFMPKDIVSGDFYWFTHLNDGKNKFSYLAVCDSTGHGVPGAFMSLLNISFINEAINEKNILEPGEVFNHVRLRLIQNLGIEGQQDGFDGILLRINHSNNKWDYAAANNSPLIVNKQESFILPCDKMPVGKGEMFDLFKTYSIPEESAGMLFLPTDGYSDQFGGEKGKKLKYSNMLKYFAESGNSKPEEQKKFLRQKFETWKGNLEQLDDVCVIGLKISAN